MSILDWMFVALPWLICISAALACAVYDVTRPIYWPDWEGREKHIKLLKDIRETSKP